MLRQADYVKILAVLEAVEDASSLKDFRASTLDALHERLGYTSTAFLVSTPDDRLVDGVVRGDLQRRLQRHLARWPSSEVLTPEVAHILLNPNGVIDLNDVLTVLDDPERRRAREFFRTRGVEGVMAVWLETDMPTKGLLTVLSTPGQRLGAGDRERLRTLAPHLGKLLRRHLPKQIGASRAGLLTPREAETVDLVAAGYSNRQIAERLDVTESTVKKHVSAALTKLGVRSRTQLTLAWLGGEATSRRRGGVRSSTR